MLEKERVYQEEIKEKLREIYDICIENNIQMISTFCLGMDEEGENEVIYNTYVSSTDYNSNDLKGQYALVHLNYIPVPPEVFGLAE